ncbi:hypothetical protein [Actinomadura rubrisoli]|uniref:Uncharacterized protein n=1 Tax=Actinomadura rubrisoli TaxID=2530368 RepID=A0A4V2YTU0_9ACTN|nr:hypothetical protein [Actinomadura rubrisoli]TDD75127.1 hypothetical protein E1298_31765 [Actinomadura rubrisoli]
MQASLGAFITDNRFTADPEVKLLLNGVRGKEVQNRTGAHCPDCGTGRRAGTHGRREPLLERLTRAIADLDAMFGRLWRLRTVRVVLFVVLTVVATRYPGAWQALL